jgi:hypothetical protein
VSSHEVISQLTYLIAVRSTVAVTACLADAGMRVRVMVEHTFGVHVTQSRIGVTRFGEERMTLPLCRVLEKINLQRNFKKMFILMFYECY